MKRELNGKQFTCVELSFIRFCIDFKNIKTLK